MKIMRFVVKNSLIAVTLLVLPKISWCDDAKLEIHGAGWLQLGRVENSFTLPNSGNNYAQNWLGNSGGILSVKSQIDEHWDAGFGIGTIMVHLARGARGSATKWYPFWVPFVSEARLGYTMPGFLENRGLQLNFGATGYTYNPDSKNLGNYLLHGYTYPGILTAGSVNIFGLLGKAKLKSLSNDFIVNLETEEKPVNDISIADVITYSPIMGIDVSAGVNFYRLIPMEKKLTSPGSDCNQEFLGLYAKRGQDNACFILEKDSSGKVLDTILGGYSGTKAVLRLRLDPKALLHLNSEQLGGDDFVIYSEAGIIGLKNYKLLYNDLMRRIPIMVGFNFPGYKFLNASLEVEYYANKLSGDNLAARNGSWVSVVDGPRVNTKRDDWKWSFNVSKLFFGNLALSSQVANDHMRLGGNHDDDTGVEAMRTLEDWYWTTKLAYFF